MWPALIAAGGALVSGLMQQKAQAEQARKQRSFDILSDQAKAQMNAEQQKRLAEQQALGQMLQTMRSGLTF